MADVIDFVDARTAWAWKRIEALVTAYVNGDPEMAVINHDSRSPPRFAPRPRGEGVSYAVAMQAGLPREPIRELWAKAKAHMAAEAEAATHEGGAA
jgi:hypothetical protein